MVHINKIVIFGATGNTGLCCVRSAVELGLDVTTFLRNASKLPEDLKAKVNVIEGDATNPYDVETAVQGQDGVVIVLGKGVDLSPTTDLSEGTKNILAAMSRFGISRVSACLSSFAFRELSDVPERFLDINNEHLRMLEALKASTQEWIAVLPPHIADTPATGCPTVTHGVAAPSRVVSKHDLGKFLVECLNEDEHVNQLCGICNESA